MYRIAWTTSRRVSSSVSSLLIPRSSNLSGNRTSSAFGFLLRGDDDGSDGAAPDADGAVVPCLWVVAGRLVGFLTRFDLPKIDLRLCGILSRYMVHGCVFVALFESRVGDAS